MKVTVSFDQRQRQYVEYLAKDWGMTHEGVLVCVLEQTMAKDSDFGTSLTDKYINDQDE